MGGGGVGGDAISLAFLFAQKSSLKPLYIFVLLHSTK